MKQWRGKKWAAWLVLAAMLLNVLTPVTVWAGEETSWSAELSAAQKLEQEAGALEAAGQEMDEAEQAAESAGAADGKAADSAPDDGELAEAGDSVQESVSPAEDAAGEAEQAVTEAVEPPALAAPLALPELPVKVEPQIAVTVEIYTAALDGAAMLTQTSVTVPEGATALAATKAAAEAADIPLTTGSGAHGEWVDDIAGISAQTVREMFAIPADVSPGWIFSVNDRVAEVYPGSCTLQSGDRVRWDFSVAGPVQHAGTTEYFYPDLELLAARDGLREKIAAAGEESAPAVVAAREAARAVLTALEEAISEAGLVGHYLVQQGTKLYGPDSVCAELEQAARALDDACNGYISVTQVAVEAASVCVGRTQQLTAVVTPEDASNPALEWVITVDLTKNEDCTLTPDGRLTAGSTPGIVMVQAQAEAGRVESVAKIITITAAPPAEATRQAARQALDAAADWLHRQQGDFAVRSTDYSVPNVDTTAFLLARLGKLSATESGNYYRALCAYAAAHEAELYKVTDWHNIIGAVNALGYQPETVGTVDFRQKLLDYNFAGGYRDCSVCTAILKTLQNKQDVPTAYTVEDVVNGLLAYQNGDGGFGFSASYSVSSVDNTGDAFLALAPYREQAAAALTQGMAYLVQAQGTDGGYGNANTTARALLGLAALGIDPLSDQRFHKDGGDMVTALLALQNDDGGFAWQQGQGSNGAATIDAVAALSVYVRLLDGQEGLYDLTAVGVSQEALQAQITQARELTESDYSPSSWADLQAAIGAAEEICQSADAGRYGQALQALQAALENLRKPLLITNGQVDVSGAVDGKKSAVVLQDTALVIHQGTGGADVQLEVTANTPQPQVTINSTLNAQAVQVVFPAGFTSSSTAIGLPRAQATNDGQLVQKLQNQLQSNVRIGQALQIGGADTIQFGQYVALHFVGMQDYQPAYVGHDGQVQLITRGADSGKTEYYEVSGDTLTIYTKHFTSFLLYQTTASTGGGGGSEPVVLVTVDSQRAAGAGFGQRSGSVPYYDGLDAVQALKNFVGEGNVSTEGSYVTAINGLSQLDCGAESGWMYSINGVFPNEAAVRLSAGDQLYWGYTLNLGEDLRGGQVAAGGANPVKLADEKTAQLALDAALAKAQAALQSKKTLSVWEIFALAAGGVELPTDAYQQLLTEVQSAGGSFRKVTDTEKMILAVTALGHHAANVAGYDLLSAVYDHEDLTRQGNNGVIYALLALDSAEYATPADARWTRDKLVNTLLAQQNSDGGFALVKGRASDVDITAMALQALANYQERAQVRQTIDGALAFLSRAQEANGGFASGGVINCESAAQVVLALAALGIDPDADSRFVKGEATIGAHLLTYQQEDGTFVHIAGGESDGMATEQGVLALTALCGAAEGRQSIFTGFVPEQAAVGFRDGAEISPWAREAVDNAAAHHLIAGYSDGSFRPQQAVSRAEFVALLLRAQGYSESQSAAPFADVSEGDWYASAAAAAYAHGLVVGDGGCFNGQAAIDREEAAALLCRAQGIAESAEPLDFTDSAEISPWARGAVAAAYDHGLLVGADGAFAPQEAVSREMAAVIAMRLAQ